MASPNERKLRPGISFSLDIGLSRLRSGASLEEANPNPVTPICAPTAVATNTNPAKASGRNQSEATSIAVRLRLLAVSSELKAARSMDRVPRRRELLHG